jgi:hypothetical protein
VLTVVLVFAGCKDSGLPGMNLPLEEARTRPFRYSTYDAAANVPPVRIQDRTWMVAGPPIAIQESLLRRIGADGAREVYALTTDNEPFDRLYVRVDSRYAPLAATP